MRKTFLLALVIALLVGGAAMYSKLTATEPKNPFRTAAVRRGDLLITVGATGTVEPEDVIDVGAQVIGRISELGSDPRGRTDPEFKNKHVDYGSPVEEGMLLAQIDASVYTAQFKQAEAFLAEAKANVLQMEAKLIQADAEWQRAQRLQQLKLPNKSPTGAIVGQDVAIKGISDSDYVQAQATYETAKATLEAAKATVGEQDAALLLAKINLGYTTIKSPVSGTIIDRRVNIGQTVVSSLNAPSIFLIAKDLRKMQVWASVNEADIGKLKVGMPASFTVDAFPKDVFRGQVKQIRLNASMTQNVVTYTVVIAADNADLKLLPYLTANVKFEVDHREQALLVPNEALRYQPTADQIAAHPPRVATDGDASGSRSTETAAAGDVWGRVWLKQADADLVYPLRVRVGASDGSLTEIVGEELAENVEIVLGEKGPQTAGDVTNPFGPPKFPGAKPPKQDQKGS